ncbi:MAG: hypothetical protein FWD39_01955 [Clostridiales bacterium]|nr:hypothetical protein [Clostridiales bacterium]
MINEETQGTCDMCRYSEVAEEKRFIGLFWCECEGLDCFYTGGIVTPDHTCEAFKHDGLTGYDPRGLQAIKVSVSARRWKK